MLRGTAVGHVQALLTIPLVSSIARYSGCRAVLESGWERRMLVSGDRGWGFDLEIGARNV
jgi:hypothetical protein